MSTAHLTPQTPLAPAIQAWSTYLADQGRSPHTIQAFQRDLRLLASYLPPDRPLGSISTEDLNRFLHWMQHERGVPCSPKTLARRITAIKSFFRWLHHYGVILSDPAERLVQKSVRSPLPVVLTDAEQQAVLDAAQARRTASPPDARPYVLVALLLETGIKKGETVAIHPNHIVEEGPDAPYLFVRYASPQHRFKERKIPLSDTWLEAYHEYCRQYPIEDRVFPWTPRRLEYLLEEIGQQAGLDKHLSFAMCRWSCALTDYRHGMEPNRIRQKLGLSQVQFRDVLRRLQQLAARMERQEQP